MPYISLSELLKNFDGFRIVDTRAPDQFQEGHLPGAQNIPFHFQEVQVKHLLGTWQRIGDAGPDQLIGHFAEPYRALEQLARCSPPLLLYDHTSGIPYRLLDRILARRGQHAAFLRGGFAGFRTYQERFFDQKRPFYLLTGYTGCGKTEVLRALADQGAQVIDLERLAGHRGSVFGGPVTAEPTTPPVFINKLWQSLLHRSISTALFVEQKGTYIGNCAVPAGLLQQFASARRIHLSASLEHRVERLKQTYAALKTEDLILGLNKLQAKLPPALHAACIQAVDDQHPDRFIRLLLSHYDQTKQYNCYAAPPWLEVDSGTDPPESIASKILEAVPIGKPLRGNFGPLIQM